LKYYIKEDNPKFTTSGSNIVSLTPCLPKKSKNGKVIGSKDYEETGSHYLWYPEIREKIRSKL
jgi:hypothetical protein